jgi:DNA-binding beta-propeller fold protein YncE
MLSLLLASLASPKIEPTLLVLNKRDNTVWLIDLKSGEPTAKLDTGPNPNEVAVSPDGTVAAISNMGAASLSFVDLKTRKVTRTVEVAPHGAPHGIVWLSDSKLVFTSHATDNVVELDVPSGKVLRALPTEQKGTHLVLLPKDQKQAYAVNALSGSVTFFDFQKGTVLKNLQTGARAEGISLSPDGKSLACGNVGANTVSMIDLKKQEVTSTWDVGGPIRTFWSADGKHLLVSSVGERAVVVLDSKTGKEVAKVDLKGKPVVADYGDQWPIPMNFAMRKNGNILVVSVTSHAVAEIDPASWKVARFYGTGPLPDGIAVSE